MQSVVPGDAQIQTTGKQGWTSHSSEQPRGDGRFRGPNGPSTSFQT